MHIGCNDREEAITHDGLGREVGSQNTNGHKECQWTGTGTRRVDLRHALHSSWLRIVPSIFVSAASAVCIRHLTGRVGGEPEARMRLEEWGQISQSTIRL
jgi:hypothetical protein